MDSPSSLLSRPIGKRYAVQRTNVYYERDLVCCTALANVTGVLRLFVIPLSPLLSLVH